MKRCPECGRDYNDDSMSFCLDDGSELLFGPASDEPATAVLHETAALNEAATRAYIHTTGAEARSRESLDAPSERHNLSAHRAAKLPIVFGAIILLLVAGWFGYRYFSSDAGQIDSIAVLPFVNDSGNADIEYLSDGMTETLINTLSQLQNLSVKARSSVFRYKGKEFDPKKIAADLNVKALLTGRLARRGEQILLNLELVDPRTENALWGKNYERRSSELAELQTEVIRDVTNTLRQRLSGQDRTRIAKQYTTNSEAYQLYLQGRYLLAKRSPATIRKANEYFTQAIEKDKSFALGYTGLSDSYSLLSYYSGESAHELMPRAKELALQALSIDNELAEAHRSLGFVLGVYYFDNQGAEREYLRAIELDPSLTLAYSSYGTRLCLQGRFDEGLPRLRQAVDSEPVSVVYARLLGDGLLMARRYDEAMSYYQKAVELDPSFSPTQFSLAFLHLSTGRHAEAVEALATHHEMIERPALAKFGRDSFASGGWQGYLRAMTGPNTPPGLPPYSKARFLAVMGEKDKAIAELERSYAEREYLVQYVKVDALFDSFKDDPRVRELIRKAGLF